MKDYFAKLLKDATDFLFAGEGTGVETTRLHSWPWPPSLTILLLAGAAALVIAVYIRERGTAGRFMKTVLAAIRIALICLVVFMMYGWMLHRHTTDLPDIVVMIDESESMATMDHYDDRQLRDTLIGRLRKTGLDGITRLNLAKLLLLENDGRVIAQLQKKYNLKVYAVGGSARVRTYTETNEPAGDETVETATGVIRSIEAREDTSRLGKGVRDVLEAQRGRPTAAVILLTDGVTTEGKTVAEAAQYARRKAVPFYIVGLGNEKPPRDLRLSDLLVDEVVFVGDVVNIDFKVSGPGFGGQSVAVRLKRSGSDETLAEQTVAISQDGEPTSARLSFRPQEIGDFHFTVEAERLDGEANPDNNHQTRLIKVRDQTLRVLYVQEYPSFEFRFLKNVLSRSLKAGSEEKAVELTTVLQEADLEYAELDETAQRVFPVSRDELFAYDVLIFGDANPSFLSRSVMDNIVAFVEERGGGVVFIAGPRCTPLAYRETPLAKLLPIDLDTATAPPLGAVLEQEFTAQPTRLGIDSPQMQLETSLAANLGVWRTLPGFYWLLEVSDLRHGARALAVDPTRTGSSGENLPVICMQFFGAGKVIFHATDESYRWSRHESGEHYHARYWIQTIRYLSRSKLLDGSRLAELTSDREEYRRGESVRLRVRFFDDRLAPEHDDGVTVVMEREGSKRRQITLRRDSVSRGVFDGTASNLADGHYRVWVATPTLEGRPPSRRFAVVAPPGEQARLEMDADDLRLAAKTSQGRFYTIETARKLLKDLPRGRQVRIESLPPTPIWNLPIWAALFVVLIATEWLLRKKVGLL